MKVFRKTDDIQAKNLVVLDIGSQFLKALFVEVDKKECKGVLRAWVKEEIKGNLSNLCEKAIKKLEKNVGLKAEELFLGIYGIKGSSATFCCKREKPNRKIDLSELKHLVQKAQWKAFDDIKRQEETSDIKLINAHIVNIKVDGSSLINPLGFHGQNICLSIFNNYASAKELIELSKLADSLGLELIGIGSSFYALFYSLDLKAFSDENILIIDVGARVTEVNLIVKGGEIMETKSFHLGGNSFNRALSDFLGIDDVESIKVKYSKGVSLKAKRRLEKLLESNMCSWASGINVAVNEFLKKHEQPTKAFLCGGGSNLPGIKREIDKNFKTKLIFPREIGRIENRTKFKEVPCLALANLALVEESEFSNILKRVIRLIQD